MSVRTQDDRATTRVAAERLEAIAPGYLAQVRRAAGRLGVRNTTGGDLDGLLDDVADQTHIDAEVPTASRRREVRLVKVAVKRLTGWYLRYLAQQVTALGESVSRLGRELAARSDALEIKAQDLDETVTALTGVVDGLRQRVARLEYAPAQGLGDQTPPAATARDPDEAGKDPLEGPNPQRGDGPP
jgi:hypothetical protein